MKKGWFTVIIANYNGAEFLKTCLDSVFRSIDKKYKVLVVDDNSSDESTTIISAYQKKHKNLLLVKNKVNLGPSGSRNVAIGKVDTEYVYFLDNDTEVSSNWLLEVRKVFEINESVASVQSLLVDFDDRKKIQNAGLKLIRQTGWAIGIDEGLPVTSAPKTTNEIIGLSAAQAVKTKVFKEGINFDGKFYHYSEDLDFSWRLWIAGYKILLAPRSIVYHKVKSVEKRKNVGANNQIVYFHLSKNSLRSLTKNYELYNLFFYLPQCVLILISRAILVLLIRKDFSSLIGTTKAFLWYLVNIKDTLAERRLVQTKIRKVSDKAFINSIMVQYGIFGVYKKHFSQTKLLPI